MSILQILKNVQIPEYVQIEYAHDSELVQLAKLKASMPPKRPDGCDSDYVDKEHWNRMSTPRDY